MSAVRHRIARLEQVRGRDHPRFLIVHGAGSRDEAIVVLTEKGVVVGHKDMVDWEPGPTPPTVEVIPMSMSIEDALQFLDAQDAAATSELKPIRGNQDARAR
jgi:hypothetical protein